MAKNSIGIHLSVDYLERCQKLTDDEFGRLIRAGLLYRLTGKDTVLPGREHLLWDGLKVDIDNEVKRQVEVSKARSEAGRKGGRPAKAKEAIALFAKQKTNCFCRTN